MIRKTIKIRGTKHPAQSYDYLAPDGSEIRKLLRVTSGNLVLCSLPKGGVSAAVRHRTVEEIWYFLSGEGEVWRKQAGKRGRVVKGMHGTSIAIPTGTSFQFRNTGNKALCFIIVTMPPWPGKHEALKTEGKW